MSYTDEFNKQAYFGDLYELTIEDAAKKIHEGLWDPNQATVIDIIHALIADIESGTLKTVRGRTNIIGKYTSNPAILNAFELDTWAEKNGLELESNGAWNSYILTEAEYANILIEKLETLRALEQSGKSIDDILKDENVSAENYQDQIIKLLIENEELKKQLNKVTREDIQTTNSKSMTSLFKIVSAMAYEQCGYRWKDKKSPIPTEISESVTRILGETIDPDTVLKWLRHSSEQYPPKI